MSAVYSITITTTIILLITTKTTITIKDIMTMTPGRPSPLQPSGRKARKCQRSQQQLFAWSLTKSSQVSLHKYYLNENRLTSTNCQILTWTKIFPTRSKTPPLADSSTERDLLNDSEGEKDLSLEIYNDGFLLHRTDLFWEHFQSTPLLIS